MNENSRIELISAASAVAISTLFGFMYNQANLTTAHYHRAMLPFPTQLFSDLSLASLAAPLLFAGLSFHFFRKDGNSVSCRILFHAGWLYSFAWALLAVWAWYLPHVAIGELAK